ncbi:MAG: signal peptidase I, partial [Clostridiales bacterium]|nr:signal peptidase I [Clostridiales bacterium]
MCSALLGVVVFALILFAAFNLWVNRNCFLVEVSGESMLNTVEDKDLLYVRDIKAKRGDVVIISVKECREEGKFHFSGDYIIKRVIALEGDCVKWEDGVISVKYAGKKE